MFDIYIYDKFYLLFKRIIKIIFFFVKNTISKISKIFFEECGGWVVTGLLMLWYRIRNLKITFQTRFKKVVFLH